MQSAVAVSLQLGRFQNAPVLLHDGSAKRQPGFSRVPGDKVLQCLLVGVFGVRGADGVDGEGGDGTPIRISGGIATARALSGMYLLSAEISSSRPSAVA